MTWIIGINVKRNSSRSFHGEISTYVEIRAYNYLNNKEYVEYVDEYPGMIDIIKKRTIEDRIILQNAIKGIELKPLPHMLALTNLILHDIEVPNIVYDDALSKELTFQNEYIS